jgi:hypothetical protein
MGKIMNKKIEMSTDPKIIVRIDRHLDHLLARASLHVALRRKSRVPKVLRHEPINLFVNCLSDVADGSCVTSIAGPHGGMQLYGR